MVGNTFSKSANVRGGIWLLGIAASLFAVLDKSVAALSDDFVSLSEFSEFLVMAFLLIGWMYLKPSFVGSDSTILPNDYLRGLTLFQDEKHLIAAKARMQELESGHVLSQVHVLPFSYIAQIYHLLNLRHLETVHNFSLGSLKIIDVSNFQPTSMGGSVKFTTTLDSQINILKMWRPPTVEVDLTLHTPYMVELSIPVHGSKRMTVIFNVLPLSQDTHQFSINIYTDLEWPKALLRMLLHVASLLTLYEDLPYLEKLSERSFRGLLNQTSTSGGDMMWLFRRFTNLYASQLQYS